MHFAKTWYVVRDRTLTMHFPLTMHYERGLSALVFVHIPLLYILNGLTDCV